MAIKHFNERYSGWGTQTSDGKVVGLEGYTLERAEQIAREVRANMESRTGGILEVKVRIEPRPNGKFDVVNTSTYEA